MITDTILGLLFVIAISGVSLTYMGAIVYNITNKNKLGTYIQNIGVLLIILDIIFSIVYFFMVIDKL